MDVLLHRYESGPASIAVDAADAANGTNASVVATIAAVAGKSHVLAGVSWSYSAAPTSGSLTLSDGTTTLRWDVTAAGPGFIPFPLPLRFAVGAAVTLTLAAGGSGIVGRVAYLGHWKE